MTMMMRVITNGTVELHGNISRNGYGNAIIGRYGGCFEDGIGWKGERAYNAWTQH